MKLIFKDSRLKKQMVRLFVPFLLQELVIVLTTLMSNYILKWWGCYNEVIIGVANVFQIFFFFNIVTCSICYVANLFMSQHYGRGAIDEVERDYYVLLKVALVFGLVCFILAETIPEYLLFFSTPNSLKYGVEYLRYFAPVFIIMAPTYINYALMKNMHLEKYSTISSVITFLIVFTLESSLMFGVNVENLALEFAATSMIVARLVEFIFCFIIINKKCSVKFRFKNFFKSDLSRFKSVLHHGTPILIAKISWALGFIFITVFTNLYLPDDITLAHSLIVNYENLLMCIGNAVSIVVAILIGRELGANRLRKAKDHASDISRLLFVMGVIQAGLLLLFLPIAMFTTPVKALEEVGDLFWIIFLIQAVIFIPRSYNASYINGLFAAGGDSLFIMLIDGITAWVTIVPLAYIGYHFHWNPIVIYAILQLEEVFKFPIVVIRYKQMKWVKNITHKKGIVFNE